MTDITVTDHYVQQASDGIIRVDSSHRPVVVELTHAETVRVVKISADANAVFVGKDRVFVVLREAGESATGVKA